MVADLAVVLDHAGESATDRLARLDERAGGAWSTDARVVAGSAADVADLVESWHPGRLRRRAAAPRRPA
ncbi:hypothetical protein [Brachybacterium epidermidis]|uniref:hypothetical protein n=1 Tax=Brachybacterium epidermidis TaxID=2781983 RepID=UPI00398F8C3E